VKKLKSGIPLTASIVPKPIRKYINPIPNNYESETIIYRPVLVAMVSISFCGLCPKKDKPKKTNFLSTFLVDDQSPYDLQTYDPNSILENPNYKRIANKVLF